VQFDYTLGGGKTQRNPSSKENLDQILYLTVYPGECSTLPTPGEGEIPDKKIPKNSYNVL
jgi:hypothetical protein